MKRFLFAAVATLLCVGFVQFAEAGNRGRRGNHGHRFNGGNHFKQQHNFHKPVFHQKFHRKIVIGAPKFHHGHLKFHNYHLHYGRKFSHGYCYFGKVHQHWASTIWSPDCGCYVYYCPYTYAWYYWCQPDGCYYPISYCPYGTFAF